MPLDDINHEEGLYTFLGGNDPDRWTNIAKALQRGTSPYEIKTGQPFVGLSYDPTLTTFGGIESEGRVVPAAAMGTTASLTFGDGVPRRVLPNSATTDVYCVFALEEWWLKDSLGMYIEWSNDHTAAGSARWQFELKEIDIATERLSEGDVVASKTVTSGSVQNNGGTMTTPVFSVNEGDTIAFTPGPIASFYVVRISRLGGDALDTIEGPVGLIEFSYVRGQ